MDYHVSAKRKRDGYKQIHVSVGFTKYGNMLFRPVLVGEMANNSVQSALRFATEWLEGQASIT